MTKTVTCWTAEIKKKKAECSNDEKQHYAEKEQVDDR